MRKPKMVNYETITEEDIINMKEKISFGFLLPRRKLSEETLEKIIDYLDKKLLLKTQKLSIPFICKYFVNDPSITMGQIVLYQKYTHEQIKKCLNDPSTTENI